MVCVAVIRSNTRVPLEYENYNCFNNRRGDYSGAKSWESQSNHFGRCSTNPCAVWLELQWPKANWESNNMLMSLDEMVTPMHKTTTLNMIVSVIWFDVTLLTFQKTLLLNLVYKYCHGWWIGSKTLPSFVSNLWWDIVMDDWKLDEKSLGKWQ